MLKYEKSFTFDQNVNDLADHLAGKVRALEDERNMVASSPNAPQLREVKLAAIDLKLATLRLHAEAAAMGVIFHDPRDVSGCDPAVSAWVSKARELGRLVNPTNFGPSLHASKDVPIKVIRGGNGAHDLGSPAFSDSTRAGGIPSGSAGLDSGYPRV